MARSGLQDSSSAGRWVPQERAAYRAAGADFVEVTAADVRDELALLPYVHAKYAPRRPGRRPPPQGGGANPRASMAAYSDGAPPPYTETGPTRRFGRTAWPQGRGDIHVSVKASNRALGGGGQMGSAGSAVPTPVHARRPISQDGPSAGFSNPWI